MPTPVHQRVRKRRDALRDAGLRPVQIWVPDTRRPGFAEECRRQSRLAAAADAADADLDAFLDAALADLPDDETHDARRSGDGRHARRLRQAAPRPRHPVRPLSPRPAPSRSCSSPAPSSTRPLLRPTVQPSPTNGLRKPSQVMIDKAMSVKRDRVGPPIGRLDDATLLAVTRSLAVFLGIA